MIQLLAITPPDGEVEPRLVDAWVSAGVKAVRFAVLLRAPGLDPLALVTRFRRLLTPLDSLRIPVLLSIDLEDLDLAADVTRDAGLAGVQLRGDPAVAALDRARQRLPNACLGRSCHGAPQPGDDFVDYTCFAPVFSPRTQDPARTKHVVGTVGLRAWTTTADRWIVALGGITPDTAQACLDAGARGLASISTFFGAQPRVIEDVRALVDRLEAQDDVSLPSP